LIEEQAMQNEQADGVKLFDRSGASREQPPPLAGLVRVVHRVVVATATTCLALLMFLVAAEVIGRYVFNRPIPGSYELIEYLMAVLIPLSVALCAEKGEHVGVDLVVEKLSRRARGRVEAVTLSVTVLLCGVMAWQCAKAVPESYASGLKSAVLQIPAYPTVVAVAVGAAALTLFVLVHFLQRLKEVFSK
jgi:TRAP-type C4-dicarboxylate transport system permease small subunit